MNAVSYYLQEYVKVSLSKLTIVLITVEARIQTKDVRVTP